MGNLLIKISFVIAVALILLLGLGYSLIGVSIDTPPPVATTLASPWQLDENSKHPGAIIYRGCASCHLSDGLGRSDGAVPLIAGQPSAIIIEKLKSIRSGRTYLPVMQPFANALNPLEMIQVADYISQLPTLYSQNSDNNGYRSFCASCHGPSAEGNVALLAPALCNQQDAYMKRRLEDIRTNRRGDANPGMVAVLNALPIESTEAIINGLSKGHCGSSTGDKL